MNSRHKLYALEPSISATARLLLCFKARAVTRNSSIALSPLEIPILEDEMNNQIKLALIYGSKDEAGLNTELVKWATEVLAQRAEFEFRVIELTNLMIITDDAAQLQRRESLRHLARADAFLIITSEQSNGYPCELQTFIDQVANPWQAKPVAFIGYGGLTGGLHAIGQLRQALAALHAVPICDFVSFSDPWALLDENGLMRQPDQTRLPMARMLIQLNWWARALKAARDQVPYERVS